MTNKQISTDKTKFEEQESLSQKVRNWTGSEDTFLDIKHRLEKLFNYYEQKRIASMGKEIKKK